MDINGVRENFKLLLYLDPVPHKDFGFILQHPIFESSTMVNPDNNEICDITLDQEALVSVRNDYIKMISNMNFSSILSLIRKQYRIYFISLCFDNHYLSLKEASYELIDCWSSVEHVYDDVNVTHRKIEKLLRGYRKNFSLEDRNLASLPEVITIYRGAIGPEGYSWTINKDKAEWFANRFDAGLNVYKAKIPRVSVVRYLQDRGEDEIICLFKDVYDIETLN